MMNQSIIIMSDYTLKTELSRYSSWHIFDNGVKIGVFGFESLKVILHNNSGETGSITPNSLQSMHQVGNGTV